ncbi:MAG: DUF1592 domain-containing protein [Bryobacteraceae bacterium]
MKSTGILAVLASLVLAGALPLTAQVIKPEARDVAHFRKSVDPFLATHCIQCHNEKVRSGEVDLAQYRDVQRAFSQRETWEHVLRKVRSGEMPPPGLPRPLASETHAITQWIEKLIERQDRAVKPDPGRVTARRLNRTEYNNTVRDLLGVDLQPAGDFPADDAGYGFDNIGDVLSLSPVLMEKYMAAAENITRAAIYTPRPVRPTMERYQTSRSRRIGSDNASGKVLPYSPRGTLEARHSFPYDGEYEIRLQSIDRRRDGAAPARFILTIDGKKAAEFGSEPGDYKNRLFDHRVTLSRGIHTLGAYFPPEVVEWATKTDPPEEVKPGKKIPEDRRRIFADFVEIRGPYRVDPPPSHQRLFVCGLIKSEQNLDCARLIVGGLARRAFRRPVTPKEVDKLVSFAAMALKEGETFEHSIGYSVQAILVSPQFLFRIERDPNPNDAGVVHPIGDFELATRLSYFLWSSMPDESLCRAAAEGSLRKPAVLEVQIRRMLADPKSRALVENFAGQWLHLRNLENANPDPDRFPAFDDELRLSMLRETELFFEHLVRRDGSILDFLDAKYTFLNERLAVHYGVQGVAGDEFRRVDLEGDQRSGVLTQASILTVSSYPTRTSPVIRGKWILENILGTPPPPPPPNVPVLKEEEVGNSGSLRQQMEKHRSNPMCASCHAKMDAIGFGLENYDAIGRWRTQDGKFPVEAGGQIGGQPFTRPAQLKALLRANPEEFARCLTEKMMTYALGRGVERYDRPAVQSILADLRAGGYRFSTLILGIVKSMPFQMRRGDGHKISREQPAARTAGG